MRIDPLDIRPPRQRLTLTDSPIDMLVNMSEGNPGAVVALSELMKSDELGILDVLHLDDMGMRGAQIWVAFKDHCKQDVALFRKLIRARDQAMVDTVNASNGLAPGTPKATRFGDSFR